MIFFRYNVMFLHNDMLLAATHPLFDIAFLSEVWRVSRFSVSSQIKVYIVVVADTFGDNTISFIIAG